AARAATGVPPLPFCRDSAAVSLDVGQQRDVAGPLDGGAELALVPGRGAGEPGRQDLAALGQEAGKQALILVVDDLYAGLPDRIGLSTAGHYSSSSSSFLADGGTDIW